MFLTRYLLVHELNDAHSVLVNTLSGALDVIENRWLPLLNDPSGLTSDCAIFQPLLDRGYIFPSKSAEQLELQKLYRAYSAQRRPMTFVVCPTYACNLRCVYCFEGSLPVDEPRVLSGAEIDAVFDAIDKLGTFEPHIQLFGGEPFLPATKPAVTHILRRAAADGYPVSAVTNGVNIEDYLPLLESFRGHIDDFQITLDGPAAIHDLRRPRAGGQGTYSDIMRGIGRLLDSGFRVRMRVNVDRVNIAGLVELAEIVADKGWNELPNFLALLSPVDDHEGGVIPNRLAEHETAEQWFDLKRKHPQLDLFRIDLFRNLEYLMNAFNPDGLKFPRFQYCESNNLSSYTFGTDGNIYLCAEAIGDSRLAVGTYYPEFRINEDAVARWNGRSIMSLKECRECSIATLCGGGCAIAAARVNGSLDHPYCHGAHETIHAYLDQMKGELIPVPESV